MSPLSIQPVIHPSIPASIHPSIPASLHPSIRPCIHPSILSTHAVSLEHLLSLLAKSSENTQEFTGLLVVHNNVQTYQAADNVLLSVIQMEKQNLNSPVRVKWSAGLTAVPVSENITGAMAKGELISERNAQTIPFALLVVTQDKQQYYITGFGGANAFKTVESFRLPQP